ncbi:MAG TPA: hypothetical protein VFN37_03415 [Candidatus Baltobacteraceae bacterium]|nr:hypothetical protein [Candidatus Baltobacteraceae bacterium]
MTAAEMDQIVKDALHGRLNVEIPEADYARVRTLEGLRPYLAAARAL